MSLPLIFINGSQTQKHSVLDRAFAFGDGVFETLLCEGAELPLWEFHRHRLLLGCERLHIQLNASELESQLTNALTNLKHEHQAQAVCKITVTRGIGGRGYAVDSTTPPTLIIGFFPFPQYIEHLQQAGVSMGVCSHKLSQSDELAGIKHLNRLDNVLAKRESQSLGFDDGIVCDQQGQVVEATSSNLFLRYGNQWVTPEITQSGVKGITRKVVLEVLSKRLKLQITENIVSVEQLANADEAFICNSVSGIVPVTLLADSSLPIGKQTRNLQNAYQSFLKEK